MELIPVNGEALKRAMEAVSGPEVAALTLKAYSAIDQAMHFGFLRGEASCNTKTAADLKTALDHAASAYNEGFEAGDMAGDMAGYKRGFNEGDNQEAYDNGYMDGVEDARVDPEEADDYIAYLCSLDEVDNYDDQADLDGFDGTYDDHCVYDDFDPSEYTPDPDGGSPWAVDSGDENDNFDAECFDAAVARGEQPEYSREGERLY